MASGGGSIGDDGSVEPSPIDPKPTRRSVVARATLTRNRIVWEQVNAAFTDRDAVDRWDAAELQWGLFRFPESELALLGDVAGRDVVELGSGTAHVSAWLARRGARVVAVDLSTSQLRTARRCQSASGPVFPLVEADAEDLPLASASFDLVVSEHGVGAWCEPERWLPEAARVLRSGGRLVFMTNSALSALCVPEDEGPAGDRLLRAVDDVRTVEWPGGGIEHHPSHGEWIRLLRSSGFVLDQLLELSPPPGAADPDWYQIVTADWAGRWPAEDVWVAHRGPDDATVTG